MTLETTEYINLILEEVKIRADEFAEHGAHEAVADLLLLKRGMHKAVEKAAKGSPSSDSASQTSSSTDEEDFVFTPELLAKLETEDKDAHTVCLETLKHLDALIKSVRSEDRTSGERPTGIKEDGTLPYSSSSANVFNVPTSRRMETLTIMTFNLLIGIPLFIGTWGLLHFLIFPIMVLYDAVMLYQWIFPPKLPATGKSRTSFRNMGFWGCFRNYFPIALRIEDNSLFRKVGRIYNDDGSVAEQEESGAKNNFLFVAHPHGVQSYGVFLNFSTNATGIDQQMPDVEVSVQTLALQFKIPLWKDIAQISGIGDASKETLLRILNGKPGHSAILVVGGAEEALAAAPGTSDLILNKRKGFVRIAMQTGAHLVPVFSFGENDVYRPIAKDDVKVQNFLQKVKSVLGFAVPLFKGRGIFSYGIGVLPHRRRITTVVGKPMKVDKWDAKWDANCPDLKAKVDEVHKEYEKALVALYNRHKV